MGAGITAEARKLAEEFAKKNPKSTAVQSWLKFKADHGDEKDDAYVRKIQLEQLRNQKGKKYPFIGAGK